MNRAAMRTRPAPDRASLYQEITDRIIAELEAGRVPWVQPWAAATAPLAMPQNALTGRKYSGVNILILWDTVIRRGFGTQSWLTFRQALSVGGSIRKGERGTTVVYASRFTPGEGQTVEPARADSRAAIPFLKRFTVFNADQCDSLPKTFSTPLPPVPEDMLPPSIDALMKASGAIVRIGGDQAFYSVTHDYVQVPRPDAFRVPINFARTFAHEMSHYAVIRIMPHDLVGERDFRWVVLGRFRHNPMASTPSTVFMGKAVQRSRCGSTTSSASWVVACTSSRMIVWVTS